MISIVVIATVISIAYSCQYFQSIGSETGPGVPCDVCFKIQPNGYAANSYKFTCDSTSSVGVYGYSDGKCKDAYSQAASISDVSVSKSGGVCDHITFKSYVGEVMHHEGDACNPLTQLGYWEFGFVEGCFNSLIASGSADLSCTDTNSFDIKVYDGQNCGGDLLNKNYTTIHTGCQNSSKTIDVGSIINNILHKNNVSYNVSFNTSQTYFEIAECGGAWPEWATILIIVGSILCCCGCCAALGWIFCRRRKGGMNSGYVQTYG